ncbi:MAG: DoxX family membrane protein [Propionibacteriaceae bacterium]|nr:DoxX family membrane protein [Propionibacteriaceae bacterium]
MSIRHAIPRAMLASYFVISGWKSFSTPESLTAAAAPLAEKLTPLASRWLPGEIKPEDVKLENLIKCTGITQMVAAVMLATGIGRRLGAVLLAATLIPHVLAAQAADSESKAVAQAKNVGLLGATLLAAQDTQGRPGFFWRAKLEREITAANLKKAKKIARSKPVEAVEVII